MSANRLALRMTEVAAQIGVHRATVQRWCADGSLTSVRVGKTVLVLPDDLERFLQSHREGRDVTALRAARRPRRTA